MSINKLNIFWIRHAESCANFLEYKIMDIPETETKLKETIRRINLEDGINLQTNINPELISNNYNNLIIQKNIELDSIINNNINTTNTNKNDCYTPYKNVILYGNENQEKCWKKIDECEQNNNTICKKKQKIQKAIYVKNSMYKSAWLI